jgi:mannose-1-phosphate guanylyltransferase
MDNTYSKVKEKSIDLQNMEKAVKYDIIESIATSDISAYKKLAEICRVINIAKSERSEP